MKDAKGHGSDAHSTGVQQIGQPQSLHWHQVAPGHHVLVPSGGGGVPIASVTPLNQGNGLRVNNYGGPRFKAELHQSFNTGEAKAGTWALHGSVQGAKNWVANRTANSWSAPRIEGAIRQNATQQKLKSQPRLP